MIKNGITGSFILMLIFLGMEAFSAPFIRLDSVDLAKVRQMIHDETASEHTLLAYKKLLWNADQLISMKNPTVIDKSIYPPTQNKHDYLSISRYWWPNPKTSDGLPWMRKDGETNPETQTDAVDRKRLSAMSNGVKTLSLAYYFSGDERYAEKATSMIKTWFLDEKTRMNPHLKFAQSVPGHPKGRPFGILDGRSIVLVIPDAMNLLSNSPHWTSDDNSELTKWLKEYLTWLTESDLGKEGSELDNNHGSWYKFQVAALALYLGNKPLVRKMVTLAQQSLDFQLNDQGGQIHEIERTRSFFYSCFNLDALTSIAFIAGKVGMDMWHYKSEDGKSLLLAVNYLTPVISGKAWSHPSKQEPDLSYLLPILARMSSNMESNELENYKKQTISILVEKEKIAGSKNKVLQKLSLIYSHFTY